jgi:hypothetical protein
MSATGLILGTQAMVLEKSENIRPFGNVSYAFLSPGIYAFEGSCLDLVNRASNSPIAENTVTRM